MSVAEELKSLQPILEEFLIDPNLKEFHQIIQEMLLGIDNLNYDNRQEILDSFTKISMEKWCLALAMGAHQNSSMYVSPKKWYEYDDD